MYKTHLLTYYCSDLLVVELKLGRNRAENTQFWNKNSMKVLESKPNRILCLNIKKTGTRIGTDIFMPSFFWFFGVQIHNGI